MGASTMSTSITTAFVRDYNKDFQAVFQRPGASLRDTVRTKTNVIGKSTTFQKMGTGVAIVDLKGDNIW